MYAVDGFQNGKKENVYLADRFTIGKRQQVVTDPVVEGYPFFAGYMVLEKRFSVEDTGNVWLSLPGNYARCDLKINGKKVEMSYFGDGADIGKYLQAGENVAEITLYTGNRNLLGPHHYGPDEDPSYVAPRMFELPGSWKDGKSEMERSSYSFAKFGLF